MNKNELHTRWKKMESWADIVRFGTLGILLVSSILILLLPREFVQSWIWYWVGIMLVLTTLGFILGEIAIRRMNDYFNYVTKELRNGRY